MNRPGQDGLIISTFLLHEEREGLGETIRKKRSRARQIKEAIALRLHFTGIDVKLCPNCETDVEQAAIQMELNCPGKSGGSKP